MKNIEGHEGYLVDTDGAVWSTRLGYAKKLKLRKNKLGYMDIQFSKNSHKQRHSVHRLIALTFIDNPNNYPCVNHIDGDKQNNKVENLEWCTHRHNNLHAVALGLVSKTRKSKARQRVDFGHLTKDTGYKYTIEHIDDILEMKHVFGLENKDLADILGISRSTYTRIILSAWQQAGVK